MPKIKILVTGGPVHAHLDPVKIITNKFKGRMMQEMAHRLQTCNTVADVTYLTAKGMEVDPGLIKAGVRFLHHNGIEDYKEKVLAMAPESDAVVLGAAVANLIPVEPFKTKFPSHNYNPNDVIQIPFKIAPRIIDQVKTAAPNTKLFGFKLLQGVRHEELITAAYKTLLDSKATVVFANDADNLAIKYMVTKERGTMPQSLSSTVFQILDMAQDEYYTTNNEHCLSPERQVREELSARLLQIAGINNFTRIPEGFLFGTVAVRHVNNKFLTTSRGKKNFDNLVYVGEVDNHKRTVTTDGMKATLNAPLLYNLFASNPGVAYIVHTHELDVTLPHLPYAPPATKRDSVRLNTHTSFNIEGHGVFRLFKADNTEILT